MSLIFKIVFSNMMQVIWCFLWAIHTFLNNWLLKSLNDFVWFFTQCFYIAWKDLEHSTQEWTMFCNTFMVLFNLFGYWQALYIFVELNRAAWKFCKMHYFVFNERKSVKWFWNTMREIKWWVFRTNTQWYATLKLQT